MKKVLENKQIKNSTLIYVFIENEDTKSISGHFANSGIQRLHRFSNLADMINKSKELMETGAERFDVLPLEPSLYDRNKLPKHSMLFIVDIKYVQNDEWQGIICGSMRPHRVFKNRGELKDEIEKEIGWIRKRREDRRGIKSL